jgi:hypothetical protein
MPPFIAKKQMAISSMARPFQRLNHLHARPMAAAFELGG